MLFRNINTLKEKKKKKTMKVIKRRIELRDWSRVGGRRMGGGRERWEGREIIVRNLTTEIRVIYSFDLFYLKIYYHLYYHFFCLVWVLFILLVFYRFFSKQKFIFC